MTKEEEEEDEEGNCRSVGGGVVGGTGLARNGEFGGVRGELVGEHGVRERRRRGMKLWWGTGIEGLQGCSGEMWVGGWW